jgi:hypothetical protein
MTKTTDKTADEAFYTLRGYYSGDDPDDATILVTVTNPNVTSSASVYIADILNAQNDVTRYKVMYQGEPSLRMIETAGESGTIATAVVDGVWSDTQTYDSGTKGDGVKAILSNTDATQAKVDQL